MDKKIMMMMKDDPISRDELNEILRKHDLWLHKEEGGERADLSYKFIANVDLSGVNLAEADLSYASLSYVNLSKAFMRGVNLSGASCFKVDLSDVILSDANLSLADLACTNLTRATLIGADLTHTNLAHADLSDSNLGKTNIALAHLAGANLAGAKLEYSCPLRLDDSHSANFDDAQLIKIAYYLVKAGLNSTNASVETKEELAKLIDFANKISDRGCAKKLSTDMIKHD